MYQQASCVKRGGPAKKVLKECKKQQKNYKGRLNIVEKLVEECGYPAKAVERAVIVCGENHFEMNFCSGFVICTEKLYLGSFMSFYLE